ncbi:MAG: hypothetical protein AAFP90_23330, partial [Planctomycetota bacterium]
GASVDRHNRFNVSTKRTDQRYACTVPGGAKVVFSHKTVGFAVSCPALVHACTQLAGNLFPNFSSPLGRRPLPIRWEQ